VAFRGCRGLDNLAFLSPISGSRVTTVGPAAFRQSGVTSLLGMEGVRQSGNAAFASCVWLQSTKGWPASMTKIPGGTFRFCVGLVHASDISHVTAIGPNAFEGCTSLLPPSLAENGADPAAVLAYLKEKFC
jgi:hypothetical protein